MSFRLAADVLDSSLEGATATLVMLALAGSADDDGGNCFPGTRLIARRARVSERTVIATIQQLEAGGWLQVLQRGVGRGNMTEYRLNAERLQEAAWATRQREREERCNRFTLSRGKKRVKTATQKGETGAQKGEIDGAPLFVLLGQDSEGDSSPLSPPLPRGTANQTAVGYAVDQVCSALGIANRRKRRLLAQTIELEAEKGDAPATVALRMIEAWNAQAAQSPLLRAKFGLARFFGEGIWKDQRRWCWDEERLRLQAEARAGSR